MIVTKAVIVSTNQQVKDCMGAARLGQRYAVPQRLLLHKSNFSQAVENMATEEMRKKPPDLQGMQSTKRRLGNIIRDGETEILEGDHKALLVFGGTILQMRKSLYTFWLFVRRMYALLVTMTIYVCRRHCNLCNVEY